MKRTWVILLAIAVALVVALPAGAKKPDKPPKPDGGFRPIACQLDEGEAFAVASIRDDVVGLHHSFAVDQFVLQPYTVDPTTAYPSAPSPEDILCAEVRVISGTLGDLRVRWHDYLTNAEGGCYLARARGKELNRLNNDDEAVFAVGLSLENWTSDGGLCGAVDDDDGGNMTVVVMPATKVGTAEVEVTIGIDRAGG